ncbi:tetratricopeptide repeat protein [Planctomycetota bacterium]
MKSLTSISLTICLMSAFVTGISDLASANTTPEIHQEAQQHFETANEFLKNLDYESAIAEYGKVIALSSGSEIAQNAQYWIGQSQFRAGRFDAAQATFAKLLEDSPTSSIVPVTKLMAQRVQQAKKDEEERRTLSDAANKGFIIDPDTGVKFAQNMAITGKKDVISYTVGLNLSPNGKFLLHGVTVIPLGSGDPFSLVDMSALRGKWSPDGKKVAFYSKDALWIVPVSPETGHSTGPPKKLLDGRFRFQRPVSWSPDGQKLVFTRYSEGPNYDVWMISVTDGLLTQITSTPTWVSAPAWSPDGKIIAYGRPGKKNSLWLSSVDGRTATKIVDIDSEHRCIPIWSPDGKWIVLEPGRDKTLRIICLADKKEYALVLPGPVGNFFSWSPGGRKLLFYNPPYNQKSVLKVVSASGGPSVELGGRVLLWPYGQWWSSDSRTIIVEGQDHEGEDALWIVPLSGKEPVPLRIDFDADGSLIPYSLSPQWNKVVFSVRKSDGTEDYWVAPISLEEARTTGPAIAVFKGWQKGLGGIYGRSWSPDGSRIAISHDGDIWIAKSAGDAPVQVTKTPEAEGWPRWSGDGKQLYYIIKNEGESAFYSIPASGGEPRKMLDNFHDVAWHPNGSMFVVAAKDGNIGIDSISGSNLQVISNFKNAGLEDVHDICLSPDGKHIACIGRQGEKGYAGPILMIAVDDGTATWIAMDDDGAKYWLSWSPDGKWISYNSNGTVKTRPEGIMWEVDFEEILQKASH